MKRYIWPVLFFTLFISAISCTDSRAELKVMTDSYEDETVFPYYAATLTQKGSAIERGSEDGIFLYHGLKPGKAEIEISAIDEVSGDEFKAKTTLELQIGPNLAELTLEKSKTGTKDMVLHFNLEGILDATLENSDNGRVLFQNAVISDGIMNLDSLTYGNYRITIGKRVNGEYLKKSYDFTCSERTPSEMVFMEDGSVPGKGNVKLEFFDLTTSPIEGQISITREGGKLKLEMTVLKMDREIDERDLEFLWFENGIYRNTGRTIEIDKTEGVTRFDCFIKSRFIGSYGSESISISISR